VKNSKIYCQQKPFYARVEIRLKMNKVKFLLTYRYTEIIHDLTIQFTKSFLMGNLSYLRNLSNLGGRPDYRQADQMNQAARSGKQNIVEAVGQSKTSKKGEIKLLGVANASIEELISDFEDFLRQNTLEIYPKTDPKITSFRKIGFRLSHLSNLSHLGHLIEQPKLPKNPQDAANFLITLCHQATYLLSRQIAALETQFAEKGGFTEKLFRSRLTKR
jgi:restriction system protein